MATYNVTAPNGSSYSVEGPDGASQQDIVNAIVAQHPDALTPKKPEQGLLSRAASEGESLLTQATTGIKSLLGDTGASAAGLAAQQAHEAELAKKYAPEKGYFESIENAYKSKPGAGGVYEAAKDAAYGVPKALAGAAPMMAEAAALGRLGAMAGGIFGPVGAIVGGVAAPVIGLGVNALGSFQQEKAARQQAAGQPINTPVEAKDIGLALGQGALMEAQSLLPLGRSFLNKVTGIPTNALLKGAETQALEKLASESLLKTVAKGTATGLAEQVPIMAVNEMLHRAEMGDSLTSPDALAAYAKAAQEAVPFAPMGIVGRMGKLSGAREELGLRSDEAGRLQAEKDAAAKAEQDRLDAEALAQKEAYQKTQEYLDETTKNYQAAEQQKQDLLAQKRKIESGSLTETADILHNKEIDQQIKDLQPTIESFAQEYNKAKKAVQEKAPEAPPVEPVQPTVETPTEAPPIEPLTAQEKQELERQRVNAQGPSNVYEDILSRVKTGMPTTAEDVARIKDTHETAVIEGLLAKDEEMKKANALAEEQRQIQQAELQNQSNTESMLNAIPGVDAKIRESRILSRVQSLIDDNIPFASSAIADLNSKLQTIGEAPLSEAERARVQNIMGMTRAFTDTVKLPEVTKPIPDKFADNQQMENAIKERLPDGSTERIRKAPVETSDGVQEAPINERVGEDQGLRSEDRTDLGTEENSKLGAEVVEGKPSLRTESAEAPLDEAKISALQEKLKPILAKFGLKDVDLNILKPGGAEEGSYARRVLSVALDSENPIKVLRHETIHALKELGFFTEGQARLLDKQADKVWIDQFLKNRNVDGAPLKEGEKSRYDAYHEMYKGDMQAIREEAIADAFAHFDQNGAPKGIFSGLLAKMRDFFTRVKNVLAGEGFKTSEDIFKRIESGELTGKEQTEGTQRASLRTDAFKRWFGDSKVVDADGKPLVVYHGTSKDFSVFKQSSAGKAGAGIYMSADPSYAKLFAGKDDANIMPLYASIKKPMIFNQKDGYPLEIMHKKYPEIFPKDARDLSDLEVQKRIKDAGYDGVVQVDDQGKMIEVVAFDPTQIKSATGNVGAYGKREVTEQEARNVGMTLDEAKKAQAAGDMRFSLRKVESDIKSMPNGEAILNAINGRTTKREELNYPERMMKSLGPQPFSYIRQKLLYRYNQLGVYGRMVAKEMGGIDRLADIGAEQAALDSDRVAGVVASAIGIGNRTGGVPVYTKGYTTIDNDGGKIKGVVATFAPLAKYNDPAIYQAYQFWAMVKRGERLTKEGREKFTPDEVAYAKQLEAKYPEFVDVQKDWIKYNDGEVKYMIDTGVITEEAGKEWTKYSDYVPFYRQIDGDETIGPRIFQNITGVKAPKSLKGGEAPVADFLETVVRNTQAAIQAGMKNIAGQRAVDEAVFLGLAKKIDNNRGGSPNIVSIMRKGKEEHYLSSDPLWIDSVKSLNLPEIPFLNIIAAPASFLRSAITKDPSFMLAGMMKDSISAYAISGADLKAVTGTINGFTGALRHSPEYQKLLDAGVIGGYEFARNTEASAAALSADLRKKTGTENIKEKALKPVTKLWEYLEHVSEASESAARISVYKDVLAKTGNEAEAIHRAMEVMNFNRKGNSPLVRILTAAIPFLNAKYQSLDVFYRAGIRPYFSENATPAEREVQRKFLIRAAAMTGLSAMYAASVMGDPVYEKQEQEVKDNNWIIPSLGIRIPIPFEFGLLFKTIPEHIYRYSFGKEDLKDLQKVGKNALGGMLFTPIAQSAMPILEAETNYSFFTGRPIVGAHLQGLAPEYQVEPNTSSVATELGKMTGLSPVKIDHVFKGYTGTMGMYLSNVVDSIANIGNPVQKPSMRMEQTPVLKRFLVDENAMGNVSQFYELKTSVEQAVKTVAELQKIQSPDLEKYVNENAPLLQSKSAVEAVAKKLQEIKQQSLQIRQSTLPPDQKRDLLQQLVKAQNDAVQGIQEARLRLGQ